MRGNIFPMNASLRALLNSTALGGAAVLAITAFGPSLARAQEATADKSSGSSAVEEIVVTGSRIRSTNVSAPGPTTVVDAQTLTDQGFVQAGQALNQLTSVVPNFPFSATQQPATNQGQQFPNLSGLGNSRTLTLMNGQRMPTTSSGLGGAQTDTNIIPVGLLQRIDVVQGGGSAVYGSGAVAGVVNYILKDHFEGVTFDTQYGNSGKGDYPVYSERLTMGKNFADNRGNVAVDIGYSQSPALLQSERTPGDNYPFSIANPTPGPGKSNFVEVNGLRELTMAPGGVIVTSTTPGTGATGFSNLILTGAGGTGFVFNSNGSLSPFVVGTPLNASAASVATNGDGFPVGDEHTLVPGIKRTTVNALGHYDITDHVKVSAALLFSDEVANDKYANTPISETGPAGRYFNVAFNSSNPFLTPATVAQLKALSPTFAAGGNLYLGDMATDLLPSNAIITTTKVYRGHFAVDGDFKALDRDFYWGTSASLSKVTSTLDGYDLVTKAVGVGGVVYSPLAFAAAQPVVNASGQIVCSADKLAISPTCVPLNLFGLGNISPAAQAYVTAPSGQSNAGFAASPYTNRQEDYLATFGGDVIKLPAGEAKFALTYEHRRESVVFSPLAADAAGYVGGGTKIVATSGHYSTNEFAGELALPILGDNFNVPFSKSLDVNGSYRIIDHSLAGRNQVWGVNGKWRLEGGLTLRASVSRNFNAPSLTQLIAPQTTSATPTQDPCSNTQVTLGPNPTARAANCLALFTANPNYGLAQTPGATTAAQRLAGYFDPSFGRNNTLVTSGGNPNLENEESKTNTYGFVYQPSFAPGFTLAVDRVEIEINNAFSTLAPLSNCFDTTSYPNAFCASSSIGRNSDGDIVTLRTGTVNAVRTVYKGDIFNVDYRFGLNDFIHGPDLGSLDLNLQATHNETLYTAQPLVTTVTAGTTGLPSWVVATFVHYTYGSLRVNYAAKFLPAEPINATDTSTNAAVYPIKANVVQNISADYTFKTSYTLRAGIDNFMNTPPSYPTSNYGDPVGRQFFIGLRARY
ncbi:MAG: outer rane receptor family protein [Bradyrhizobium sp.]|nr:outer rane receptor family protein [Bradyrhizobium sp.]